MSWVRNRDDDFLYELLHLDRGVRVPNPTPPPSELRASWTGGSVELSFLVSTNQFGVVFFSGGSTRRVTRRAWAYGLLPWRDRILVFERAGRRGILSALDLESGQMSAPLVVGLPPRLHQIALAGRSLVATDPYNNRLISIALDELSEYETKPWRSVSTCHYPAGRSWRGRGSANYCHFNSVFAGPDLTYVIAHNDFNRSGRLSDLWVLDHNLTRVDRRGLGFENCHNYYVDDHRTIFLASNASSVVVDGVAARLPGGDYLRGLQCAGGHVLVGSSERSDRPDRSQGHASVHVLDQRLEPIGELQIAGCQIYDVLLV